MNCPICHAAAPSGQTSCLQCGASLSPVSRLSPPAAEPATTATSRLIVLLVTVCLALCLGAYFYVRAYRSAQPQSTVGTSNSSSPASSAGQGIPRGDPIVKGSRPESATEPGGSGGGVGPGAGGMASAPVAGVGNESTDYNRVFSGRDVSQKARVFSKPEAGYTEEARRNQVTGTVVLKAIFTSSGTVTEIVVIKSLPFGLTEKAIAAAREIKFNPAIKDGRNVSQYIQLEYTFNLY